MVGQVEALPVKLQPVWKFHTDAHVDRRGGGLLHVCDETDAPPVDGFWVGS